jgi:hypothetical protein
MDNQAKAMPVTLVAVSLSLCLLHANRVLADGPLPAPELLKIKSPNGKYFAVLDPAKKETAVFAQTGKDGKEHLLWKMPGWFRDARVADDGEHLVIGYDGINLIPLNYQADQVMVTLIDRGKTVKSITLKQIIGDFKHLQKTVSHYNWGTISGIDKKDQFTVETVEGRKIVYDAATLNVISDSTKTP